MSATPYPGPFSPDSPAQRLPWILLIAVLLVLLALAGLGRFLKTPARPAPKPKPLQARIYELPASRGAAAAKPTPRPRKRAPGHPLPPHPAEQLRHRVPPHARPAPHAPSVKQHLQHRQAPAPKVRARAKKGVALAQPKHTRRQAAAHAAPRHHKVVRHPAPRHRAVVHSAPRPQQASPQIQPSINWGTLQSQIDSAVQQSVPSLRQIHDPHTLVARYYIASLLQKLQRIGDMNYPGNLTGVPVLRLVIGRHGQLLHLTLLRSSGNDALDRDALDIARESAPFAPFPDRLKRQTSHIELVCYMSFNGYRQLYAGY